jgi:hypothetical protein
MGTEIKVTSVDAETGAKEMSKLHLSKPPDDTDAAKGETKDSGSPGTK